MYEIDEVVTCNTSDSRPDFDRACGIIYGRFLDKFGIDESGNIHNVKGALRSSCSLEIKFKNMEISGGMNGITYTYIFTGKIISCDED